MKNTTIMYIEHIAIGMQTTLLLLFLFICIEPSLFKEFKEFSAVMEFIIVIPIAYALGILIDRISKLFLASEMLEKWIKRKMCEKKIPLKMREKYGCKGGKNCRECSLNMVSKVVWSKYDEIEYYNDARTRKRILRATCINSSIGTIIVTVLFLLKMSVLSKKLSIALIVCLAIIALSCLGIYIKFMFEYYDKQKKYIYLWKSGKL